MTHNTWESLKIGDRIKNIDTHLEYAIIEKKKSTILYPSKFYYYILSPWNNKEVAMTPKYWFLIDEESLVCI